MDSQHNAPRKCRVRGYLHNPKTKFPFQRLTFHLISFLFCSVTSPTTSIASPAVEVLQAGSAAAKADCVEEKGVSKVTDLKVGCVTVGARQSI